MPCGWRQLLALEGLSFADLDAAIIATRGAGGAVRPARLCAANISRASRCVVGDPALDSASKLKVDRPEAVGADRLVQRRGGA